MVPKKVIPAVRLRGKLRITIVKEILVKFSEVLEE